MPVKFWRTSGKYGCFSNFSKHPIKFNGKEYPTSEHLYQAMKATTEEDSEKVRNAKTAKECKNIAYSIKLRSDWEDIKIRVMKDVVRLKVKQHPVILKTLLETGKEEIIEDSPYDSFWGCGKDGKGKNVLGNILIELREEFKNDTI